MAYKAPWKSNITSVKKGQLVTYGIDQTEMIQNFSYEEMVYLLIHGKKPTAVQLNMLRAVLVAYCSHGITGQSTLAVRMAADCRASFMQAAFGGFGVGSGPYHQGALELSMQLLIAAKKSDDVNAFISNKM